MRLAIANMPRQLGYQFNDLSLLEEALMHRSYGDKNNERLEFLGDSVVNFVIAAQLFQRYPQLSEGDLSRMRAQLVKGETLAKVAQELNVGGYMRLGPGELKTGGTQRKSILADTFEAILGAIYLDGGFSAVEERVIFWFSNRLDDPGLSLCMKDPKTLLQEHVQANKLGLPNYEVVSVKGEAHEQHFHVSCQVDGLAVLSEGEGSSRRRAEQQAAKQLLKKLNITVE